MVVRSCTQYACPKQPDKLKSAWYNQEIVSYSQLKLFCISIWNTRPIASGVLSAGTRDGCPISQDWHKRGIDLSAVTDLS